MTRKVPTPNLMENKRVALVTGGFDPLHPGHVAMFTEAKRRFGYLIVGINSDAWLSRKKGRPFMHQDHRITMVKAIAGVDDVITFNDDDETAINAIQIVHDLHPDKTIFFCNGGDRTVDNIPEMACGVPNVEYVFGVGGDHKECSSSALLEVVKRPWGFYHILAKGEGWLVKRIVVNVGHSTSLQYHQHRDEQIINVITGEYAKTQRGRVHRLTEGEYIELQTGLPDEDDIIRVQDNYGRVTSPAAPTALSEDARSDCVFKRDQRCLYTGLLCHPRCSLIIHGGMV